jgi:crossover junction endodeoxyribonuclease RuvC
MKMAHVRGVIFSVLADHEVEIYEYSPREIKKSITGNGNASKDQVKFMIARILNLDENIGYDQSDALAVALTYINRNRVV